MSDAALLDVLACFAEARVLKVADAYQRDTEFHTRRPPILDAVDAGGVIVA